MMKLNCELLDLRALIAVADGRSFHRAAEQLNLSQPALSRRIQKLELAVGGPILDRSTRTVRLTPVGQEVLPLLRRILEKMGQSLFGVMALGRAPERQADARQRPERHRSVPPGGAASVRDRVSQC